MCHLLVFTTTLHPSCLFLLCSPSCACHARPHTAAIDWLVKLKIIITVVIIYSDILQSAPFRSQIKKNFLRLRLQGGIDPPTHSPADALGLCNCITYYTVYVVKAASNRASSRCFTSDSFNEKLLDEKTELNLVFCI